MRFSIFVVLLAPLFLAGCFQNERACADELRSEVSSLMGTVDRMSGWTELQRANQRVRLTEVSAQITLLEMDEHRNICDYYLQSGGRLALK